MYLAHIGFLPIRLSVPPYSLFCQVPSRHLAIGTASSSAAGLRCLPDQWVVQCNSFARALWQIIMHSSLLIKDVRRRSYAQPYQGRLRTL